MFAQLPLTPGAACTVWQRPAPHQPLTRPCAPPSLPARRSSLAFNSLSGPLPPSWGALARVRALKLQKNNLSGAVPPSWGGLKALETIALFDNAGLTGCLPPALRGKAQAPTGAKAADARLVARGTKITAFC